MITMKIAVTYENENVFQHFGHTKTFKLYEIEEGKVIQTTLLDSSESGHGALADFLKAQGVTTLICGGIGGGAQEALQKAGIPFFGGVSGNADQAVADLLADKLQYDPNIKCSHHGEGHEHSCQGH